MNLHEYIRTLDEKRQLIHVSIPCSKTYEAAGVLKQLEPRPVLFHNIKEVAFPIAGNLFCQKSSVADYFGLHVSEIIGALVQANTNRKPCPQGFSAPCQEVIEPSLDLDSLPILKHCSGDGGNYVSAGVVISSHPDHGQNLDFHRCMQISKTEMALRVVNNRHFDLSLREQKQMDIAICVGVPAGVLLAAATSLERGIDELTIANALEPTPVIQAKTVDLWIPAESEFVLEGTIFLEKTHPEGPFVDLTGTYDIVRQQPVFVVNCITHRKDAIWHALLPGGLEHKLLMGMPREPTIFEKVNQVVKCLDVYITPGGCSWLHAVVKIQKQHANDGMRAIQAAFEGHRSCKHVFVVDEDIDIYDPSAIEWALATRFQGNKDMLIKPREQGSSLDPSANPKDHFTTKIGYDLTRPLGKAGENFTRVIFPQVDIQKYLKGAE